MTENEKGDLKITAWLAMLAFIWVMLLTSAWVLAEDHQNERIDRYRDAICRMDPKALEDCKMTPVEKALRDLEIAQTAEAKR